MLPCIVLLHGEQILPILAVGLLVSIAALTVMSVLLTRAFRRRLGSRAYALAAAPWIVAFIAVYSLYKTESFSNAPPTVWDVRKMRAAIRALPSYAHVSYSGVAFFRDRLYISTNVGLIELENGHVTRTFRVQKQYSVVSGPWTDMAHQLCWIIDDQTGQLLSFDSTTWRRVRPPPATRYLGSGEGPRFAGNENGFWLASGGGAWRWERAQEIWIPESAGNSIDASVIGVLPIGDALFFLVRHELLPALVKPGQDFASDSVLADGSPIQSTLGGGFLADTWASAGDAAYVCSKTGVLIEVTPKAIKTVAAPGECEAVSSSGSGTVLAGFRAAGIYEYRGGWQRLAPHPYPGGRGEYWLHIAGDGKRLAVAIEGKSVVDCDHSSSAEMKFTQNAPTSLWLFEGHAWRELSLQ
jgi:hypothetical protein